MTDDRPRLLDLFCGAGGASVGYHRAGFEVIGVDVVNQPNYPFAFEQADALSILRTMVDYPTFSGEMWRPGYFAAIHASPPCQEHSTLGSITGSHTTGWMLAATVELLGEIGLPYVVENVPGADMPGAFTLCGRAFGIRRLKRHRQFMTSFDIGLVPPCACAGAGQALGVYGDLHLNDRNDNGRRRAGVQTARDLMDCQWMEAGELSQAIPPIYTEFIGEALLAAIGVPA